VTAPVLKPALAGRLVLLVENEFYVAGEVAHALRRRGATVIGPVPDVRRALALIARADRLDGAILDVRLRAEDVFRVAAALRARGVPFVLATGFDPEVVPAEYRDVPRCEKPLDVDGAAAALFGSGER
jgi:hypothetical protein